MQTEAKVEVKAYQEWMKKEVGVKILQIDPGS
jgi:hypothetical protein